MCFPRILMNIRTVVLNLFLFLDFLFLAPFACLVLLFLSKQHVIFNNHFTEHVYWCNNEYIAVYCTLKWLTCGHKLINRLIFLYFMPGISNVFGNLQKIKYKKILSSKNLNNHIIMNNKKMGQLPPLFLIASLNQN